jgi:hypothetical protein
VHRTPTRQHFEAEYDSILIIRTHCVQPSHPTDVTPECHSRRLTQQLPEKPKEAPRETQGWVRESISNEIPQSPRNNEKLGLAGRQGFVPTGNESQASRRAPEDCRAPRDLPSPFTT